MFLGTLKTLILAGKETLQETLGVPVSGASVSQVHQGRLSFPAVGEIRVRSGTLQTVHLGCDQVLTDHLANNDAGGKSRPGVEALTKVFLGHLLAEMEGRHPRGKVTSVRGGTTSITTRGIRSYGLRLSTARGQLFMLAEIPSKVELEQAKGSDFLAGMMATYLPRDWMQREALENHGLVQGLLKLLTKIEADYHLEIPLANGEAAVQTGITLEERVLDGRQVIKLATELTGLGEGLQPGTMVHATAGLEDRSLECELEYLGPTTHPLAGGISLDSSLFAAPERFDLVQRRKAFRIPVPKGVRVEMLVLDEDTPAYLAFQEADADQVESFHLADLSFSGARLTRDSEEAPEVLAEGRRVICRMIFPDEFEPLDVLGLVRRCTKSLANRNEWQLEVGLEFLISPDLDRRALDFIRQYVLAEQRAKLANRVAVARSR